MIDLRSDTVTHPTKEMMQASMNAELGDDVFGDDPTVNLLEEYAAELLGMEAAVYVTSGTQGNLSAILAHTRPGDEVILESGSHIFNYEVGGMSAVGGVIARTFNSDLGYIDNLEDYIRGENIHFPITRLLCIENTHSRHGGYPMSIEQVKLMADAARDHDLKIHLDGARIFNTVAYYNTDIRNFTSQVDSIQICLSKGLSAPVGSLVAGSSKFIDVVRKKRKMLGGGMRQAGIIAAPGLIALKNMRERLGEDHDNARKLATGLKKMGVDVSPSWTNIVVCDVSSVGLNSKTALEKLYNEGVLAVPFSDKLVRLTTHRHISAEDIDKVIAIVENTWLAT